MNTIVDGLDEESRVDAARRVLVVDDHRTFADLLQLALAASSGLTCVGVAYSVESALDRFVHLEPDTVVIDYRFTESDRSGVDAALEMLRVRPATKVVLLTGHADQRMLADAARAGVSSLLAKDGNLTDLITVLLAPPHSGLTVHPTLLRSLVGGRTVEQRLPHLTAREAETLDLLTLGLTVGAIADQMGVSVSTCRSYVKSLLSKLNAHSQLEAVAIARRFGRVSENESR